MAIVDELHRPAQKPAFGINIVAPDFETGEHLFARRRAGPVKLILSPMRIGSAALTGTATKIAATDVAMSADMVGTRCRALGLKCTNVG
jgi:hypothetical protein